MRSSFPSSAPVFWPLKNGSPPPPPVAEPDIQVIVRTESDHAAVVIFEWLRHGNDHSVGGANRQVRIDLIPQVPRDDGSTVQIRITDIEAPIGRVLRIEREAQQALFSAGRNQV